MKLRHNLFNNPYPCWQNAVTAAQAWITCCNTSYTYLYSSYHLYFKYIMHFTLLFFFFFFQGVSLAKVIEAGDFICTALSRQTNSKVAQARGKALWCVPAGRWCLNMWLPFKMLPLLLLPSDLLPQTSHLFIWALFILVEKIRSFKPESSPCQCCPFVACCVWSKPDHYFCVKCFEWLFFLAAYVCTLHIKARSFIG